MKCRRIQRFLSILLPELFLKILALHFPFHRTGSVPCYHLGFPRVSISARLLVFLLLLQRVVVDSEQALSNVSARVLFLPLNRSHYHNTCCKVLFVLLKVVRFYESDHGLGTCSLCCHLSVMTINKHNDKLLLPWIDLNCGQGC